MLLNEVFGFGKDKAEEKRQAAIAKVRAKDAAKSKSAKDATAKAEAARETEKAIAAGEKRRAAAAPKNTQKRNLSEVRLPFGKKDDGGEAAKAAFREKKRARERAAMGKSSASQKRTPGHGADKSAERDFQNTDNSNARSRKGPTSI